MLNYKLINKVTLSCNHSKALMVLCDVFSAGHISESKLLELKASLDDSENSLKNAINNHERLISHSTSHYEKYLESSTSMEYSDNCFYWDRSRGLVEVSRKELIELTESFNALVCDINNYIV